MPTQPAADGRQDAMGEEDRTKNSVMPTGAPPPELPQGYRQGLITAITVLLGFSLAFLRFWGLEAAGRWSLRSVLSTGPLVVAVVLQLLALFRSLRPEDQDVREYRATVRWFVASAIVMLLGLLFALVESSLG